MLGFNVFAADTDEEGWFRASSSQQAFINLRSGRPKKLPPPIEGFYQNAGAQEKALLDSVLSCAAIGAPGTVRQALQDFIERTGADELMITAQIYDHQARVRSYEITAELRQTIKTGAAVV